MADLEKRVGLKEIAVSGVWLRREADECVVLVEVKGQWVEICREKWDGPFSHIVEPLGIITRAGAMWA